MPQERHRVPAHDGIRWIPVQSQVRRLYGIQRPRRLRPVAVLHSNSFSRTSKMPCFPAVSAMERSSRRSPRDTSDIVKAPEVETPDLFVLNCLREKLPFPESHPAA